MREEISVKDKATYTRVSRLILRHTDGGEWRRTSTVKKLIHGTDKEHFDNVLAALTHTGLIQVRGTIAGRRGQEVRRAPS